MSDILRLSLPLTLWLASFSAIYGLQGVICSPYWPGLGLGHGRIALIACGAVALALQIGLLFCLRRSPLRARLPWVHRLTTILAAVAIVATIWTVMPVLVVSVCR